MAVNYVLDTNIALYLLGGRLEEPLPAGEHFVSVITELELLAFPGLSSAEENHVREFLAAIQVVDLRSDVKAAAIALRRDGGLKLPDAIVAGTALAFSAELLTNDARLASSEAVRTRSLRVTAI